MKINGKIYEDTKVYYNGGPKEGLSVPFMKSLSNVDYYNVSGTSTGNAIFYDRVIFLVTHIYTSIFNHKDSSDININIPGKLEIIFSIKKTLVETKETINTLRNVTSKKNNNFDDFMIHVFHRPGNGDRTKYLDYPLDISHKDVLKLNNYDLINAIKKEILSLGGNLASLLSIRETRYTYPEYFRKVLSSMSTGMVYSVDVESRKIINNIVNKKDLSSYRYYLFNVGIAERIQQYLDDNWGRIIKNYMNTEYYIPKNGAVKETSENDIVLGEKLVFKKKEVNKKTVSKPKVKIETKKNNKITSKSLKKVEVKETTKKEESKTKVLPYTYKTILENNENIADRDNDSNLVLYSKTVEINKKDSDQRLLFVTDITFEHNREDKITKLMIENHLDKFANIDEIKVSNEVRSRTVYDVEENKGTIKINQKLYDNVRNSISKYIEKLCTDVNPSYSGFKSTSISGVSNEMLTEIVKLFSEESKSKELEAIKSQKYKEAEDKLLEMLSTSTIIEERLKATELYNKTLEEIKNM